MRVPVGGGPEATVLEGVTPLWWSVAGDGVYFVSSKGGTDAIERYDFRDRTTTRVGRLALPAGIHGGQMSVSPDGHWALVTEQILEPRLFLLDNVR